MHKESSLTRNARRFAAALSAACTLLACGGSADNAPVSGTTGATCADPTDVVITDDTN